MPLNIKQLEADIYKISKSAENGEAVDWVDITDAIMRYTLTMQYPPPVGVIPGVKVIKPILQAITPQTGPIAPVILRVAFLILGAFIAIGMPIGTGLGPTQMPSSPPNFDSIFSGPQDAEKFSKTLATEIDSWMRKGKFDVGFIGPNGPVPVFVPWM